MNALVTLNSALASPAAWDLVSALNNAGKYVGRIGSGAVFMLGFILILVGAWKLAMKLINGEKSRESWGMIVALIVIGGFFAYGGWTMFANVVAKGGKKTIEDLGSGSGAIDLGVLSEGIHNLGTGMLMLL